MFVCGLPVGHDEVFEAGEFFVETGVFDWWSEIGDQLGVRAALGDRAFRGVVDAVDVKVRQLIDQPIRPALARKSDLFAGHELQRAVCAEVNHAVGVEHF